MVKVHSSEFCYIFKNDYIVVHVRSAASDILGYPYIGISSARSTLKISTVFSSIFWFIHLKLILESYITSGVYLEQYQISMTKFLAVVFSQKYFVIDIWQGSKYGSSASLFNIFPLSLFGYLNINNVKYMNIFFLLWKCLATLRMWHKWCFIGSQTICLILTMEIPNLHIFMREKRKSSFWKSSRWNARLIYTSNENN